MAQKRRKWRDENDLRLRSILTSPQKSFLLAIRRGKESKNYKNPPMLFDLHDGEQLTIGRSPAVDVMIPSTKVSGKHLQLGLSQDASGEIGLWAWDCSTNGTGVREGPADEFVQLGKAEFAKRLHHGTELLLPFNESNLSDSLAEEQTAISIKFPETLDATARPQQHQQDLPDAYSEDNRSGRWKYYECLGEGGLGYVYRAFDMKSGLGNVAIKISKWGDKTHGSASPREAWQVYILHREAQWSLQYLHRKEDRRYDAELASLFGRYLEDHTGFHCYESQEGFDATRCLWEPPDFDWASVSFAPPLPRQPYVVMELAPGVLLQKLKAHEVFSPVECRILAHQAAAAIGYLGSFGLIHRDFRGSNVHVVGRGEWLRLRVLDLGLCICADGAQAVDNNNPAIQASWHRQTRQYDWVPLEVIKTKPCINFALPLHAFDVYSFGVFMMRLHGGKEWARRMLQLTPRDAQWRDELHDVGLDVALIARILGKPSQRPSPAELVNIFFTQPNFQLGVNPLSNYARADPAPYAVATSQTGVRWQSLSVPKSEPLAVLLGLQPGEADPRFFKVGSDGQDKRYHEETTVPPSKDAGAECCESSSSESDRNSSADEGPVCHAVSLSDEGCEGQDEIGSMQEENHISSPIVARNDYSKQGELETRRELPKCENTVVRRRVRRRRKRVASPGRLKLANPPEREERSRSRAEHAAQRGSEVLWEEWRRPDEQLHERKVRNGLKQSSDSCVRLVAADPVRRRARNGLIAHHERARTGPNVHHEFWSRSPRRRSGRRDTALRLMDNDSRLGVRRRNDSRLRVRSTRCRNDHIRREDRSRRDLQLEVW